MIIHYIYFFQWLESTFLGFFDDWEKETSNLEGLNKSEKSKFILSKQTLQGLRITGKLLLNISIQISLIF